MSSPTPDEPLTLVQRTYARLHRAITRSRLDAMAFHMAEAERRGPRRLLVRHLGVEHLGCWIVIPGTPDAARTRQEPSLVANGGRLVGFAPDEDPARSPSTRLLVVLRGAPVPIRVRVDEHVIVAPRDWS